MYKRYLFVIGFVMALIGASVFAQSERISLYEFAAPYPQSTPSFVGAGSAPLLQQVSSIEIVLEIDAGGAVANVSMETSAHERMALYIGTYIEQLQFVPALFQEQKVASRLPIEVVLWPGERRPIFSFPLDSLGQLINRRLYESCLELNDITPPRVKRFESYYAVPNMDTSAGVYRYVLFAIDLDSSGAVLERSILVSTYPVFDEQVKTAILWSEFAPAVAKGRSIPSTLYLMVSFFGATAYPTPLWPPDPDSVSNQLEFLRLREFADRSGLMALPQAQRLPSNIFPLGPDYPVRLDKFSARVRIDTLGRCQLLDFEKTHKEIGRALRQVVPKIKFFPALDFNGRPQTYTGRALFEFTSEANVRVDWTWLR